MFLHDRTSSGGPLIYPIVTVVVGSIIMILSGVSLFRCIRDGGIFINQLRFLASGALLILHFR